jgi:hypothetical protein
MICLLILSYAFSSTKSENKRVEQVLPGSQGWERVAQIMYTHVSKCKNDKRLHLTPVRMATINK